MSEAPSNPAESARKKRVPELDGLRAFSVALVIVYHSWLWSKTLTVPGGMTWLIDYVGLLGVKIFFVISGFIITRLMLEEVAATGTFRVGDFFIKRVFRIIPAFWIYLSATTLLIWAGAVYSDPRNLIPSLLFTSDFLQFGQSFFYAHSWSLSVEEQYYLLFPLLVILLMRKGSRTTTIILVSLYFLLIFTPNLGKIIRVRFDTIDIAFLAHFRYIIGGALLSIWWNMFGSWIGRTNWIFPAAAVLAILGMAYVPEILPIKVTFFAKYLFMLVEPALITGLMGWILYHPAPFGILRWGPIQWLGRISYSIYLWQQLVTGSPALYLKLPHPGLLTAVMLILACASLSYYCIELPFNALGRRLIKKKQAAVVTRTAATASDP